MNFLFLQKTCFQFILPNYCQIIFRIIRVINIYIYIYEFIRGHFYTPIICNCLPAQEACLDRPFGLNSMLRLSCHSVVTLYRIISLPTVYDTIYFPLFPDLVIFVALFSYLSIMLISTIKKLLRKTFPSNKKKLETLISKILFTIIIENTKLARSRKIRRDERRNGG